jgi:hypothetical protein
MVGNPGHRVSMTARAPSQGSSLSGHGPVRPVAVRQHVERPAPGDRGAQVFVVAFVTAACVPSVPEAHVGKVENTPGVSFTSGAFTDWPESGAIVKLPVGVALMEVKSSVPPLKELNCRACDPAVPLVPSAPAANATTAAPSRENTHDDQVAVFCVKHPIAGK